MPKRGGSSFFAERSRLPAQQLFSALWDKHVGDEFVAKDTTATLERWCPMPT